MTKPIELERHQWNTIFERIQKTYPTSVWALRSKMKQRLGFVPREHKDWDEENHRWRMNCVMLDFYSEKHRTLFLMKYADVINDRTDNNF
jgi:hypothetical protein